MPVKKPPIVVPAPVPANYWFVPSRSTWAQTQAIIMKAQAASGTAPIVVLPDEPIVMTAYLDLRVKPIRITGAGPNSELLVRNTDVHEPGSDRLIKIAAINGVELDHFKITYDRAALGTSSRKIALSVSWGARNVDLHHLKLSGITNDVFHLAGGYIADHNEIDGVRIYSNVVDEWYESYCLLREGDIRNVKIFYNRGRTTVTRIVPSVVPTESASIKRVYTPFIKTSLSKITISMPLFPLAPATHRWGFFAHGQTAEQETPITHESTASPFGAIG
jgi:hypothetical protein